MKSTSTSHFAAICTALALASTQVSALTLGRLHGSALLGKELDVSVLVQFAPEDDVSAACFAAEVAYGETPVERSRITLLSQAGSQPQTQIVRVKSSVLVDEAVVTLRLLAVCTPKASRRYVMLSDVLSETAPAPVAAPNPSLAGSAKELPMVRPGLPLHADAPKSRVRRAVASAKLPAKATSKPVASSKTARGASAKALNHAQAAALVALQRRVDDIATWQASNHTADDLLKSEAREKALESQLKGLHQLSDKNQKNIQALSASLDKAESENYGSFLVYGLGALLAACLGFLAFVLIRLRRGGSEPWWSDADEARSGDTASLQDAHANSLEIPSPALATPVESAVSSSPSVATRASDPVGSTREVEYDGESFWPLVEADSGQTIALARKPVAAAPAESTGAGSLHTGHASLKAISTQDMLDVREQAEFFMALGQHDDAVQLLEASIKSSTAANPLIFLDLLKIFHTLSRRSEFEKVREEFNQQFTGRIPDYSSFLLEGNGLEDYDDICQQIVVLWPTEYTVDFIEQCLVRTSEDGPEQGIDLQAFKDLLLLYGVIKRLEQSPDSLVVPFSAGQAALPPVAPDARPVAAVPSVALAAAMPVANPVPNLDLDLDLDLDFNFDLDLAPEPDKKVQTNNLIDFDISDFKLPKAPGESQK